MPARLGVLLIALVVGWTGGLAAQQTEGELLVPAPAQRPDLAERPDGPAYSGPNHAAAPSAVAMRTTERIAIDGRLDEPAWRTAPAVTNFTQLDPVEGETVSQPTEVRFLYDDEAIYVGAWLWDDGEILTRLARRDAGVPDADFFVVIFDTFHDHRTAYRFSTSPAAMKRDEVMTGGGGGGGGPGGFGGGFGDTSWDPVYELDTTLTDEGWFVEYRIPFSQLRFSPADEITWGLQIERKIRRNQENTVWAYTPKTESGGIARFGHLTGLRGIQPGRRLEILPYLGGRAEYVDVAQSDEVTFGNPFRSSSDYFTSLGADLKYRLTSNITLDATVNPDFGQVEVDPAVINLSAFETRYDEKRPFFVEGAEIFSFGASGGGGGPGSQLLYSRRIGRAPQGDAPSGAVYDFTPQATTILGAAKVTGKTDDGWSIGLLNAVTNEEEALWVDEAGDRGESPVEPFTNYFVGRLRREFGVGETAIGGLLTSVTRRIADSPLAADLHSSAYTGGIDFRHAWANQEWEIQAHVSPSYVQGSPEALIRTQRSSARYYQRPDADYLGVDSTATSLAGYQLRAGIEKQAGNWRGRFMAGATSPGYEINDIGFLTTVDRINADLNFGYEQTRPSRLFRRWSIRGGPDFIWNYGGDLVGGQTNVFGNGQFANYWGFGSRFGYSPAKWDDRLTRGGPVTRAPASYNGSFNVNSDSRNAVSVGTGVNFNWDEAGEWRRSVNMNMTIRPSPIVEVRLGPDLSMSHTPAQYVSTITDPLATQTFGRRYVFADLDQTTVSFDTRVNVTFTPNVSFELYAQPFISSGDYGTIKELSAPRTFDFVEYGIDGGTIVESGASYRIDPDGTGAANPFTLSNRDFNLRSLRGNAVFRWEWNPGSTLYLVWQQNRSGRLAAGDPYGPGMVGDFNLTHDIRELVGMSADNVFLVKFSYWLNP